ncbi:MAG: hypothetical protein G3M78_15110 [Candidatus Nitrohelix vancouverensis]|uniref:Uncharacterized protein n=1 Tax=Candidatus Nitrohelix vancouverensis TaxID=2705534 RepID=A0A7T0C529_9BACT|nr:MAG: hypothetical protein G3M78_15110 [Candidatus Nitrohelix vancouverensis]
MGKTQTCGKCGDTNIIRGDLDLRTSKDLELIMVVRKYHGIEKKVPILPLVCGSCGHVEFHVEDFESLKVQASDKPIDPEFRGRPIQEYDF